MARRESRGKYSNSPSSKIVNSPFDVVKEDGNCVPCVRTLRRWENPYFKNPQTLRMFPTLMNNMPSLVSVEFDEVDETDNKQKKCQDKKKERRRRREWCPANSSQAKEALSPFSPRFSPKKKGERIPRRSSLHDTDNIQKSQLKETIREQFRYTNATEAKEELMGRSYMYSSPETEQYSRRRRDKTMTHSVGHKIV